MTTVDFIPELFSEWQNHAPRVTKRQNIDKLFVDIVF
ncbi:hypothetical protein BH10CHL1_BH10CHL1_14330 [soil metagenome]